MTAVREGLSRAASPALSGQTNGTACSMWCQGDLGKGALSLREGILVLPTCQLRALQAWISVRALLRALVLIKVTLQLHCECYLHSFLPSWRELESFRTDRKTCEIFEIFAIFPN